jgi:hypothetical protein
MLEEKKTLFIPDNRSTLITTTVSIDTISSNKIPTHIKNTDCLSSYKMNNSSINDSINQENVNSPKERESSANESHGEYNQTSPNSKKVVSFNKEIDVREFQKNSKNRKLLSSYNMPLSVVQSVDYVEEENTFIRDQNSLLSESLTDRSSNSRLKFYFSIYVFDLNRLRLKPLIICYNN